MKSVSASTPHCVPMQMPPSLLEMSPDRLSDLPWPQSPPVNQETTQGLMLDHQVPGQIPQPEGQVKGRIPEVSVFLLILMGTAPHGHERPELVHPLPLQLELQSCRLELTEAGELHTGSSVLSLLSWLRFCLELNSSQDFQPHEPINSYFCLRQFVSSFVTFNRRNHN